jgi:hypothetical protein
VFVLLGWFFNLLSGAAFILVLGVNMTTPSKTHTIVFSEANKPRLTRLFFT